MDAELNHEVLDDVAFALQKGLHDKIRTMSFSANEISPIIEYKKMACKYEAPSIKSIIDCRTNLEDQFLRALEGTSKIWLSRTQPAIGLYHASSDEEKMSTKFVEFSLAAQKAAQGVGFDASVSRKIIAAMTEQYNNIIEHAEFCEGAIVAWKADPNGFEFCVSDLGIGILSSLKKAGDFKDIEDEGEALKLAIKEGVSRHGVGLGSGYGFRPIFVGLANLRSDLRFRSGDHALVIEGGYPDTMKAGIKQKVGVDGFHASVRSFLGRF